ncbi:SRPBCC family protein [Candidatus Nitrospira bockiana]
MNRVMLLLSGAGIGAGLMYILDPEGGNRRRALVRDKLSRAANVTGEALDTTWRDVRNRATGVTARVQSVWHREDVSDATLVERVRSQLGFLVRHPGSIEVCADQGRVILSGPVLADEVDRLVSQVRNVRGVREVENRLEVHEQPGNVPGLQGEPPRRPQGRQIEWLQTNWSPSARAAAGATGAALAWYGGARRDLPGTALALVGLALVGRALTNLEMKRLVGIASGRRAIDVVKTIRVAAPVDQVFNFWASYDNFPHFMSRVQEVRKTGEGRSRWRLEGPGGVPLTWEAVLTRFVPNRELAWKTEPGSTVQHAGIVKFTENQDGTTTIHLRMTYNPPAGAVGHGLATLLGEDAKTLLDEDLMRMKSVIESGIVPHDAQQPAGERTETAPGG